MEKQINAIREYLRHNNFYAYRFDTQTISGNYLKEYRDVADPGNKRNLSLQKRWADIVSFGDPRQIVIVDLGGTNLNLFNIDVKDEKTIAVKNTATTGFYEDKVYTPEILFTDLKKELDRFILASEERATLKSLVFIFSYPLEQVVRQDGYIDATCTKFIKEHKSEGMVGSQVGIEFQNFLRERGYPMVNVSVTNDTPIHCFAAKAYEILHKKTFDAAMNIIVGTGCNVSDAYDETEGTEGLRVINTEFGNFRGAPLSRFDEEFDAVSNTKGIHLNEKMISGAYQHQVFKLIVRDLMKEKILPQDAIEGWELEKMDSGLIEKKLKQESIAKGQHDPLLYIWREINKRGGALCGIFLAAVMAELYGKIKRQRLKIVVMETGSVIVKNEGFKTSLLDTLDGELGRLGHKDNVSYEFQSLPHQAAYGSVIFDTFSST